MKIRVCKYFVEDQENYKDCEWYTYYYGSNVLTKKRMMDLIFNQFHMVSDFDYNREDDIIFKNIMNHKAYEKVSFWGGALF